MSRRSGQPMSSRRRRCVSAARSPNVHDDQMDNNTSTEPQSHASSQSGSTERPEASDSTWGGISRRQFLTGLAAATGSLALSGGQARAQFTSALPDPDLS